MKHPLVLLSLLVMLGACKPPVEPAGEDVQLVRTAEVRAGRLQHQLSFHGVLEPVTRARLAFQTPGVMVTRPAQLGQIVRKGELLATLDNPELGPAQRAAAARLQESLSQRDQAKRDLARLRSLATTGAVGEEQVEQKAAELESLQATVARAEADLTGTRQRLEDATLVAPFDGVISRISVEPGEFVSAGQPVMAIGGLERVEVRVLLPAVLVSELRIGDRLTVRVSQLRDLASEGIVTELAAVGEVETGLFPVVVEVAVGPENSMLRAGMQAEVLLNYADVEGLIVPLSAIVDPVGGDPQVFRITEQRAYQSPVSIMAISRQEVALDTGLGTLTAGDVVVVAGHRALTDGQRVRIAQ